MTKTEAKKLALEKLCFFKLQDEVYRKWDWLPVITRNKVRNLHNKCPLCELFCIPNPKEGTSCSKCPLTPPFCNDVGDEALEENILILKAWEPED